MANQNDERLIWLDGEIMPVKQAMINVLSPTAQFGANVFEGLRCYWSEQESQLFAFRLDEHYRRLKNSIKMLRFEERYAEETMRNGLYEVIKANGYRQDIAVRQTVFLDGFGSWSSKGPTGMFIAPIPKGRAYEGKTGMRCCVSSWERISDRNISPRVKVGANYINSRMAQLEATANGYDSAILMNSNGKIAEGPGSCIFIVRDGCLITPPVTASVLESITRGTVIQMAKEILNLDTKERDIDRTELYIAEEIFLCGTAMEIVPVLEVDGLPVGESNCGEVTEKLRGLYFNVVRGQVQEYRHWLSPIY